MLELAVLGALDDLGLHPVDLRGPELGEDLLLEAQQALELAGLGQHRREQYPVVLGAQADHAPVALHHALRVPRHVVADHRLRLLEVLALREHVGRDQQVDLAVGRLVVLPHDRVRREARERCRALVRRRLVADHDDPLAVARVRSEVLVQVADGGGVGREDRDFLRRALVQHAPQGRELGVVLRPQAAQQVAHRRQAGAVALYVLREHRIEVVYAADVLPPVLLLQQFLDACRRSALGSAGVGRGGEGFAAQHAPLAPPGEKRVVRGGHLLDGLQARPPARLEALEQP